MFLEGKPVQFKWIVLADKIVNPLFFKKILNVQWNKTEFDLYATVEELGVTEICLIYFSMNNLYLKYLGAQQHAAWAANLHIRIISEASCDTEE